ncbi:MAG: polysaccharide biosynthesis/export family protein [Pirellulales bacterium]
MKTSSILLMLLTLATVQAFCNESALAEEPDELPAADWARDVATARALPYRIEPPDTLKISIRSDERDAGIEQTYQVGPDGNVNLNTFGRVYLAGLTVEEATDAIEKRLADKLETPQVEVEIAGYNSKKVYVIVKSHGAGDTITPLPWSRESTVLQAVFAAKTGNIEDAVHVARPPYHKNQSIRQEVDLKGLILRGDLATNYGLLPGDRVIITSAESKVEPPRPPSAKY